MQDKQDSLCAVEATLHSSGILYTLAHYREQANLHTAQADALSSRSESSDLMSFLNPFQMRKQPSSRTRSEASSSTSKPYLQRANSSHSAIQDESMASGVDSDASTTGTDNAVPDHPPLWSGPISYQLAAMHAGQLNTMLLSRECCCSHGHMLLQMSGCVQITDLCARILFCDRFA